MSTLNIGDNLLDPDEWPKHILMSSHAPLLRNLVDFSLSLEEQTEGSSDIDSKLHSLFHDCARIATWLPRPGRGRAPSYTRYIWDLRALALLVPKGLDMELDSRVEDDGSGFIAWQANLHDHINGNHASHPSDLEHNRALSYDGGEYGSAWTPNIALARILLVAYLLAVIQSIKDNSLSNNASFARAALPYK